MTKHASQSAFVKRWLEPLARGARFSLAVFSICISIFGIYWIWKRPLPPSGGLYFESRVVIPIESFQQNDPRWGEDLLGPTADKLSEKGCAITSAAMVLTYYGIDTDPKRLNQFLNRNQGYTSDGWVYWEKAALVTPGVVEKAYENLGSYYFLDWNILHHNPVIARIHRPGRENHFVVIVGKQGWDYLILDPGRGASKGIYPLRELGGKIAALRFYERIEPKNPHHGTQPLNVAMILR